jgi:hypothetical protein
MSVHFDKLEKKSRDIKKYIDTLMLKKADLYSNPDPMRTEDPIPTDALAPLNSYSHSSSTQSSPNSDSIRSEFKSYIQQFAERKRSML